jgi:hypothetical protein
LNELQHAAVGDLLSEMPLAEHDNLSRHSRRIEPIVLSQYPFCHGDRGAICLQRGSRSEQSDQHQPNQAKSIS